MIPLLLSAFIVPKVSVWNSKSNSKNEKCKYYKEKTLDHNNEFIDSSCDLPRSSTVGGMVMSSQFLRDSALCQRSMALVCESEGEGMKDLMCQLTLASG
jgi:hypothetical protein